MKEKIINDIINKKILPHDIPNGYKTDKDIVLQLVKLGYNVLEKWGIYNDDEIAYIKEVLFDDEDFVKEIIPINPKFYIDISERLHDNGDMVLLTLDCMHDCFKPINPSTLAYFGYDEYFSVLKYASERLRSDKEFVKKVLEIDGLSIGYSHFKNDKEMALIAVKQNGYAIDMIDNNDVDIYVEAWRTNPEVLENMTWNNSNNREFMLKFVSAYGIGPLYHASEELLKDQSFLDEVRQITGVTNLSSKYIDYLYAKHTLCPFCGGILKAKSLNELVCCDCGTSYVEGDGELDYF